MRVTSDQLYEHVRQRMAAVAECFSEDPEGRIAKVIRTFSRIPDVVKGIGVDALTPPIPNNVRLECERLDALLEKYLEALYTFKDACEANVDFHISNDPEIGVNKVVEARDDIAFVGNASTKPLVYNQVVRKRK